MLFNEYANKRHRIQLVVSTKLIKAHLATKLTGISSAKGPRRRIFLLPLFLSSHLTSPILLF